MTIWLTLDQYSGLYVKWFHERDESQVPFMVWLAQTYGCVLTPGRVDAPACLTFISDEEAVHFKLTHM